MHLLIWFLPKAVMDFPQISKISQSDENFKMVADRGLAKA
jgi:hypothetical protein